MCITERSEKIKFSTLLYIFESLINRHWFILNSVNSVFCNYSGYKKKGYPFSMSLQIVSAVSSTIPRII